MPSELQAGCAISIHSLVKRETNHTACHLFFAVISIHSLVKRETLLRDASFALLQNFNPLPRKEGDLYLLRIF